MQRLNPKVVWLFFIRYLFGGLFLFFFLSLIFFPFWFFPHKKIVSGGKVVHYVVGGHVIISHLIIFGGCFIVYIILCYIWSRLTYHFWRYQLTDNALKIERGVIWKKYISIPFERIQNVDIYRGLWARILGLSDLQIQTAGYSAVARRGSLSEGNLPGLAPKVAEEMREELIRRIKGTKQGL